MQEIKKEIKSLEGLNEQLDFFQVSWTIKGTFASLGETGEEGRSFL